MACNGAVKNVGEGAICRNSGAGVYYWSQLGGVYDSVTAIVLGRNTTMAIGYTGPLTVEGGTLYVVYWLD